MSADHFVAGGEPHGCCAACGDAIRLVAGARGALVVGLHYVAAPGAVRQSRWDVDPHWALVRCDGSGLAPDPHSTAEVAAKLDAVRCGAGRMVAS